MILRILVRLHPRGWLRTSGGESKLLIALRRFLLIGGLVLLGYVAGSYALRWGYQAYAEWTFNRALKAHTTVKPAAPDVIAVATPVGPLIGRIAIPRLDISAIVNEGVDARTLGIAVGHIPSKARPGKPGNIGLAAHRDTLFRNLKDVRKGDEIKLTTLEGEYLYRVTWFQIVKPTDVWVLKPTPGEEELTLITCYPFFYIGHAPSRFIVRARRHMTNAD